MLALPSTQKQRKFGEHAASAQRLQSSICEENQAPEGKENISWLEGLRNLFAVDIAKNWARSFRSEGRTGKKSGKEAHNIGKWLRDLYFLWPPKIRGLHMKYGENNIFILYIFGILFFYNHLKIFIFFPFGTPVLS